jgi:hypothetical protein
MNRSLSQYKHNVDLDAIVETEGDLKLALEGWR